MSVCTPFKRCFDALSLDRRDSGVKMAIRFPPRRQRAAKAIFADRPLHVDIRQRRLASAANGTRRTSSTLIVGILPLFAALYAASRLNPSRCPASTTLMVSGRLRSISSSVTIDPLASRRRRRNPVGPRVAADHPAGRGRQAST
jgi:hypothetical protein